jgi:hypothetical protein
MYSEIVNRQTADLLYVQSYLLVEIGGAKYYVYNSRDRSEFEPYVEAGSDAEFWSQVIINNAENGQDNLIPEKVFAEAAQLVGKSLGEEIIAIDLLSKKPDSPYTYVLFYAPDGSGYYRPTNHGRLSELNWIDLSYIPETIFKAYMHDFNQKTKEDKDTIEAYQALGIEIYTEMVKEKYISEVTEISAQGLKVESYSIGTPYRRSEDWSPINPYEKNTQEFWFVDVELLFSGKDSYEFNHIITFRMDGDKLDVKGSFASVTVDLNGGTTVYMYSAGPNPNVLEEKSTTYLIDGDVMVWMAD